MCSCFTYEIIMSNRKLKNNKKVYIITTQAYVRHNVKVFFEDLNPFKNKEFMRKNSKYFLTLKTIFLRDEVIMIEQVYFHADT